jgi:hypothetical protein
MEILSGLYQRALAARRAAARAATAMIVWSGPSAARQGAPYDYPLAPR